MSSTDTGEDPAVNSKSDNIEIMIYDIMILTNFLNHFFPDIKLVLKY